MPKFIIGVKEVHEQCYSIEAKDVKDTLDKVREGEGEIMEGYFEYSRTLDPDIWNVYDFETGRAIIV